MIAVNADHACQVRILRQRILRVFLGNGALVFVRERVNDLDIRAGQSVLDA